MRLEIFIILITSFFVYNSYNNGKYLKHLLTFKKYYKMSLYIFLGIGIYLLLKRNPTQGRNMLLQANNIIKYIPIDKESKMMINPILDFTSYATSSSFVEQTNFNNNNNNNNTSSRILSSGKNNSGITKRCVSETKKKYVASQQEWKCNTCKHQLDHTFEIDHKIRLEYGGGNDVQNLVALCRNCHGLKTANENM